MPSVQTNPCSTKSHIHLGRKTIGQKNNFVENHQRQKCNVAKGHIEAQHRVVFPINEITIALF